ncbi:MAG: isoprenylcysteine carboxylmethyltransferase family protein [Chloroflexota bacterium]
MFNDPFGWFPNQLFTNLLPVLLFLVYAADYIMPRLTNPHAQNKPAVKNDRGSYLVIMIVTFLAILLSIYFRMQNIGTLTGIFQWLGLLSIVAGTAFRQWALINLGRFFSRNVQIESGHQVITTGPYRWIRHPSYTGMILIYTGLVMALGTWLGALLTFAMATGSLLYRIRVEEQTLVTALGDEYRKYISQTWQLFPGW